VVVKSGNTAVLPLLIAIWLWASNTLVNISPPSLAVLATAELSFVIGFLLSSENLMTVFSCGTMRGLDLRMKLIGQRVPFLTRENNAILCWSIVH
jgi:hypothetical protein